MEVKSGGNLLIKSIDERGYFSGYASVFNHVDDQQDVVMPGAFKGSLSQWENEGQLPKMLWQHNQKDPIGRWVFMEEDHKGLYVEGQLLLDVQQAKEAYTLMRAGAVDGLSIGFRIVKAQRDNLSGLRYIQQVELLEVSVVTFAANGRAKITRVKKVVK